MTGNGETEGMKCSGGPPDRTKARCSEDCKTDNFQEAQKACVSLFSGQQGKAIQGALSGAYMSVTTHVQ